MAYDIIALIAKEIYAFVFLSFLELSRIVCLGMNTVCFQRLMLLFLRDSTELLQAIFTYICYNLWNFIII